MSLPPPPQDDDPIITQFRPRWGQWELTEDNIKRIDPETGHTILHNYCQQINTTPLGVYRYLIEVKGCDVNVQAKNKNTPLYNALCCFNPNKGGDITVLTYLLSQKGVDPNIKDVHGCTLLHAAFENINALPIEVFKLVIETHGSDVNVQDNNENIPLYYALFCFDPNLGGDTTVLTYLLHQKGTNGDINDKSRSTLLHAACNNINKLSIEIFQDLIETHGFDVNAQDNYKNTPVHLALRYFNPNDGGDITVLMYLLTQKGINANIKGHLGSTLLHIAYKRINKFPLDVFKILIETHGGDVNVQDDDKNTPLHDALYRFDPRNGGNITVLMYLLTQMNINVNTKGLNGETLFHKACERINTVPLEIFKLLIEIKGCDVNIQDNDKNTPLRTALRYFNPNSDIAVLAYLFTQKGINGNIKGYNDRTLLHTVCEQINALPLEIFQHLIETQSSDVNARDRNLKTPLCDALLYFDPRNGGDVKTLTYLLRQNDVDVGMKDEYDNTLLHAACLNINKLPLEIFQYLIETLGYDFNAQNKDKDTPLHLAFHCLNPRNGGDISVLRYLLTQKGINGNIVGKHGDTLLHHACKHINILPIEIFQHLIENGGCDVNAKNSTKDHPLHFAFHHFNPNGSASIAALTYLLTREGIDGHVKDKNGDTFLHLVCKRIRILPLEVFQHLIENGGCDVNALNNNKNTPIHVAFHSFNLHRVDDIAILTYLLTREGIDSHVKDIYGDTFLHLVCRRIRIFPLEVFQHLIGTIGCDVNAQNRDSDTPIHIAFHCLNQRNGSDINVWAYLINQKNLNVNIKNSNGHALLHLACISRKDSKDDFTDSEDDYMDSEDDSDGPEGNLDNHRETKAETFLCQIVEVIVERCAEQIFDEGVL